MSWGVLITIIVLGLLSLILEILVIPGGVVGIIGCLMMLGGVVMAYVNYGALAGNLTLITTMVVTTVSIIMVLRSKTWKKLMLDTKIESKMNEVNESKIQVGMEGIAVSRLAPAGNGRFGDEIIEVHSANDFIDVNKEIIITKIEGGKIIVKLK